MTTGRTRVAVTNVGFTVRIQSGIPLNVYAAVINIRSKLADSGFETGYGGSGMHQRRAAIAANNKVGRRAEKVAPGAVVPIVGRDNAEILDQFGIESQRDSCARFGEELLGLGVEQ